MPPPTYFIDQTARIESRLLQIFATTQWHSAHLAQVMQYAVTAGGKRLRPLYVLAASGYTDPPDWVLEVACAVELIHCFSLVHDDLPALDNDDWRRGQATTHRKFDEASALLAGDGLQCLAWLTLNQANPVDPRALQRSSVLAQACLKMCEGQMTDISTAGDKLDLAQIRLLHAHKTGALLSASVQLGSLCQAQPLSAETLKLLESFGDYLGLLYQVQDDILDATATREQLGKSPGKDVQQGKNTYVACLGLAGAQRYLDELFAEVLQRLHAVDAIGSYARQNLLELTHFLFQRQH